MDTWQRGQSWTRVPSMNETSGRAVERQGGSHWQGAEGCRGAPARPHGVCERACCAGKASAYTGQRGPQLCCSVLNPPPLDANMPGPVQPWGQHRHRQQPPARGRVRAAPPARARLHPAAPARAEAPGEGEANPTVSQPIPHRDAAHPAAGTALCGFVRCGDAMEAAAAAPHARALLPALGVCCLWAAASQGRGLAPCDCCSQLPVPATRADPVGILQ